MESNNKSISHGIYSVQDFKGTVQGTLFNTAAGAARIAFGVEQLNTQIEEYQTKPGNAAGADVDSQYLDYHFSRKDTAEFVEIDVPLIGPDANIPLMRKFEVDFSLRHDDYSDFGATTNPKGAFTWDVTGGLRIHGNWSTSFVAPPLNLVGGDIGLANFSSVSGSTGGGPIPVALYPLVTQMGIPGCTTSSVTCNIGTLQGISRSVGDPNAKAAKGRGWTVGFDYSPDFLPDLAVSATYWDTELLGGMTGPPFNISVTNSTLVNHLTLYPSCATQQDVTSFATSLGGVPVPQSSVFPSCVQFTYQGLTSNFYYMYAAGVDANIDYTVHTDDYGTFTFGESLTQTTKFDVGYSFNQAPSKDGIFSTLGSDGINTSFPTIATGSRTHLGWNDFGLNADLYMNYTSPYKNVGSPVTPIVDNSQGIWTGRGGDHVSANITFDLIVGYAFNDGILGDDKITAQIVDLLGSRAPYYNSRTGYDNLAASPIGRRFVLTLTTKF
jgi:iron complex outermembrane receptor protein